DGRADRHSGDDRGHRRRGGPRPPGRPPPPRRGAVDALRRVPPEHPPQRPLRGRRGDGAVDPRLAHLPAGGPDHSRRL
ncbi:MAG: hypothetical protein AVDCRST_MAG10-1091, partial [uncultured Acidimicrobiales bacterium]